MLLPRVRRVTPKFVANVFVGITFATTSCLLAGSTAYAAEELRHLLDNAPAVPTLSEYGGVGLLDTRTARFMPDGYISATILIKNPDDRVSETFQALPWMEATFRWAHNYAIEVGSQAGQGADRSFDAKFRLISESDYWPQLAVGIQDLIGTGVYSAEYIVASKRAHEFDFSLGFGWGRLAQREVFGNPAGLFFNSFKTRNAPRNAGAFAPVYFHGPVGVFGGVEYTTPIRDLKAEIEFTGDRYLQEDIRSKVDFSFPINIGLNYRPFEWMDLGLSYMHGREIGLRLSIFTGLKDAPTPRGDVMPPIVPRHRDAETDSGTHPIASPARSDDDAWRSHFYDLTHNGDFAARVTPLDLPPDARASKTEAAELPTAKDQANINSMRDAIIAENIVAEGPKISGNRVTVIIQNSGYQRDSEAISRTVRALTATAPSYVEDFEIITTANSVPITTVIVPRTPVERIAQNNGSPAELWNVTDFAPAPTYAPTLSESDYPVFEWSAYPLFRQSFFDPDNPLYVGLGLSFEQTVTFARGLSVTAAEYATFYDTFDQIQRTSNSVLPHVRSDFDRYLKKAKNGIDGLTGDYYFKLGPEIFARASAGLLEDFFAGAGGEVLYRPFRRRWALGANIWAVRQRDYDEMFGLLDYKVVTGHMSLYYDSPWYDVLIAVHAGQYLAGDRGATFEFSRTFATGWRVGAFFSLTNVSAQRFGEGSFDKGIYIHIPLEWAIPIGSTAVYDLSLRPIQRDGGQRLYNANQLYDLTNTSSYRELERQWNSVFRQ